MKQDGKTLVITLDPTKDFGPSTSGKSTIVASTGGAIDVPGYEGVKLNLTMYKKGTAQS